MASPVSPARAAPTSAPKAPSPKIPAPMADHRDFGNACPFLLFNATKMSASIAATISVHPNHPDNPMEPCSHPAPVRFDERGHYRAPQPHEWGTGQPNVPAKRPHLPLVVRSIMSMPGSMAAVAWRNG
jgi:hypothetical protein